MPGGIHVNVRLDGLDDTSQRVQDAAHIGLARGAEHVHGETVKRTPLGDTAHLRDDQEVRPDGEGGFEVYVPGPYARFQEFGPDWNPETLHHEEGESPYLSTTLTLEGQHVIEIIAQAIRAEGIFE